MICEAIGCSSEGEKKRAAPAGTDLALPLPRTPPFAHCTARVPSTDAASRTAAFVGNSVQNMSQRPPSSCKCLRDLPSPALTLCAAHILWPARASICCDSMTTPFTLECSPGAHAMACPCNLGSCLHRRVCVTTQTHTYRPSCAAHSQRRKVNTAAKMVLWRHLSSLHQSMNRWLMGTQPASRPRLPTVPTNQL